MDLSAGIVRSPLVSVILFVLSPQVLHAKEIIPASLPEGIKEKPRSSSSQAVHSLLLQTTKIVEDAKKSYPRRLAINDLKALVYPGTFEMVELNADINQGFSGKHSRLALDALSTSLDHNHLVDSAVRAKHFAAAAGGAHALEVAAPPKAGHDGSAHGVSKFHEEKRLHDENKAAVGAAEWDRDARKGERGREGAVPFANDDDDAHGGALIARTQAIADFAKEQAMKHSQQSRQLSAGSRVNKMEVIQRSAQAQAGVVAELAYQRDKKQSLADRLRAFRSAPSPILRPGYRSMAERFHVAPKTPHGDIPQPQGHDRLSREPAPMVASEVGLVSSHDAAGPRDTSAPLLELLEGDASFQDTHTDSVLAYSDVVPEFSGEVGADLESDGPGNSKREEGAEGQLPADQVHKTQPTEMTYGQENGVAAIGSGGSVGYVGAANTATVNRASPANTNSPESYDFPVHTKIPKGTLMHQNQY